jgi:hypothetical protein
MAARGPLVVSSVNPRYFAVGAERPAIYLTGSHINNNFLDGGGLGAECADEPERSDFAAYLGFLVDHGHNFIRLWRWEHFKSQLPGGKAHLCMSPQPWPRTGPGLATDGKPRFDLASFDAAYFTRLRACVEAAGQRGIYVAVMLFDGWALHLSASPDNVEGHPFHAANNINAIGIRSIVDYQVLPLGPRVRELQEAYIRKVVDTVHDLPNVLYEVVNESSGMAADTVKLPDGTEIETKIGDSTEWQYWVIEVVKEYERAQKRVAHPVGMSMQYPVPVQREVNAPLFRSHADWISPGFDDPAAQVAKGAGPPPGRWLTDPPPSDGTKIILSDTDHYSPLKCDALWAWKSFLRGHHPVFYDMGIFEGIPHPSHGSKAYEAGESTRHAMGDTLRYAQTMELVAMEPRGDLSSTGYALANPGHEYLVLQPSSDSASFTVSLSAGTYTTEWHAVDTRERIVEGERQTETSAAIAFAAPFAGPCVLYVRRADASSSR